MFSGSGYPIHHAWTVLHIDNKDFILDLSDEMGEMIKILESNGADFGKPVEMQVAREGVAKAYAELKGRKNSERCHPLGIPTPLSLYIGCPSTAQQGIDIFNKLRRKYPNHPSPSINSVDSNGFTKAQKMIIKNNK